SWTVDSGAPFLSRRGRSRRMSDRARRDLDDRAGVRAVLRSCVLRSPAPHDGTTSQDLTDGVSALGQQPFEIGMNIGRFFRLVIPADCSVESFAKRRLRLPSEELLCK